MLGKLRIIAGKWKGRKILITPNSQVRPTTDRIRETLFNWLTPYLANARCLDLYAGSGILALEALSRGASHATCVEYDASTIQQLQKHAHLLQIDTARLTIVQQSVPIFLRLQATMPYHIIFLDPPYTDNQELLTSCIQQIASTGQLATAGYLYWEHHMEITPVLQAAIPAHWQLWRHAKYGKVYYYVFVNNEGICKSI
jgi:16S rRNA (guanine966-N2)-methyltransferase